MFTYFDGKICESKLILIHSLLSHRYKAFSKAKVKIKQTIKMIMVNYYYL